MRIVNLILLAFWLPAFFYMHFEGKSKKYNKNTDIEVDFALLNKQGQPTNTFKEGEDFIFSLTLINNTGDSLYLDNSFLSDGSGFCSVYTENNELVGQPFAYGGTQIVSSDVHPFYGKLKEYTLEIPWSDSRAFWSTLHHNFRGLNHKGLAKGKYYTIFKHRFCFDRTAERPSLCLEPLNIRINFEVVQ